MKGKHYRFFQNKKCEYFPCHKTDNKKEFNCLMCYCPLYFTENCGGNYSLLKNGMKNCTDCTVPHHNYDYILAKLDQIFKNKK